MARHHRIGPDVRSGLHLRARRRRHRTRGARPRLLLLDGHSLAYRAFFALPVENFSTTTGQPTNAVYGFTSMLINILRDEKPTHLAVAFDVGRKTFRSEIFADYKANRSESPTDFRGQVSLVQEVLAALHVPVITAENYEADDVIATLTVQAVEQGMDVLIATGDRDALQLVNDARHRALPAQGRVRHDPLHAGGGRDQVRPVPGAVPRLRRAARRPERQPAEHPERGGEDRGEVGPRVRLPRRAGRPGRHGQGQGRREAARAPVLGACRTGGSPSSTAPSRSSSGPADLAVQPWDRNEVHTLFDNLQFRVLRDRLFATLTSAEPEVEGGFDVAEDDVPAGGLGDWLQANARTGRTGLIFRGTWGRGTGELTGIALAAANDHATFVDVGPDLDAADEQALAAWLADPATQKVVHEVKGPYLAIWARGWELEGVVSDTALAAYLALPGQRSFDLGDLAVRYLKRELKDAAEPEGQLTLDGLGPTRGRRRRRGRARRRPQGRGRQRPLRRPRDRARPARRRRPARRHRAAADPGAGRDGVPRHRRRRRLPADAAAGVRRRRSPRPPPSATPSSAGR